MLALLEVFPLLTPPPHPLQIFICARNHSGWDGLLCPAGRMRAGGSGPQAALARHRPTTWGCIRGCSVGAAPGRRGQGGHLLASSLSFLPREAGWRGTWSQLVGRCPSLSWPRERLCAPWWILGTAPGGWTASWPGSRRQVPGVARVAPLHVRGQGQLLPGASWGCSTPGLQAHSVRLCFINPSHCNDS